MERQERPGTAFTNIIWIEMRDQGPYSQTSYGERIETMSPYDAYDVLYSHVGVLVRCNLGTVRQVDRAPSVEGTVDVLLQKSSIWSMRVRFAL